MKQSDCFNCHSVQTKIVGPAYLDVANKYRGQSGALETSIQRVLKGSSRVWGDAPMLPHESFSADQVHLMVQWVFDLQPGESSAGLSRGLVGKLLAPADEAIRTATLDAAYTDAGRGPIQSLVGRSQIKLRSRRLLPAQADFVDTLDNTPKNESSRSRLLSHLNPTHTLQFNHLDLSDSSGVTCRVATPHDAVLEFRQGSPRGPLLASLQFKSTGGWDHWIEQSAPLPALNHRATVCLAFVGSNTNHLLNLDWLRFNPR
jgi:cytochrome c